MAFEAGSRTMGLLAALDLEFELILNVAACMAIVASDGAKEVLSSWALWCGLGEYGCVSLLMTGCLWPVS